jgi:hypothetical protein
LWAGQVAEGGRAEGGPLPPLPNHEDRTPIQAGGDEDERRTEIEYLWDAAGERAVLIVAGGSG